MLHATIRLHNNNASLQGVIFTQFSANYNTATDQVLTDDTNVWHSRLDSGFYVESMYSQVKFVWVFPPSIMLMHISRLL